MLDLIMYLKPPPAAFSFPCLHRLLEPNEPGKSISWVGFAYREVEDHAVLQVFLCQHSKSTSESYGSLISPLIFLKAVKYAFPLATVEKAFSGLKFVMEGICLREDQPPNSFMADPDQVGVMACPRLKENHFDTEAVSPDIVEGLETPIWKVMEDSQAMPSLDGIDKAAVYEDCKLVDSSTTEQHSQISSSSTTLTQHAEGASLPSGHEMPLAEATNMREARVSESSRDHSLATRCSSDNPKSGPPFHSSPETLPDLQPQSSTASTAATVVASQA